MENDMCVGVEDGQSLLERENGEIGCFAVTKGSKNLGKVMLVGGGDSGIIGMRCICDQLVTKVSSLSDEDELEWIRQWCECNVY